MSDNAELIKRFERAQDRIHDAAYATIMKLRKRKVNTTILINKYRKIAALSEELDSIPPSTTQAEKIRMDINKITYETKRRALKQIEQKLLRNTADMHNKRDFIIENGDDFLADIDIRIQSTIAHLDLIKHAGNTNALAAKYYLAHIVLNVDRDDPDLLACFTAAETAFAAEIRTIQVECPICLDADKFTARITLTCCRNAFHRECLMEWLNHSITCPICRTQLTVDNLF